MTAHPAIDFARIRDGRDGFEALVCHLAARQPVPAESVWRRIHGAGGDGGVEAYWELPNGAKWGWQAKYFLKPGEIDWRQVDESVRRALEVHPELTHYVIALACDLSGETQAAEARVAGRGRPTKSAHQKWEEHVARWQSLAPNVRFERWDEDRLRQLLLEAQLHGAVLYYFDTASWGPEWFQARFEEARAKLGDRYRPDDHVVVQAQEALEGLVGFEISKWQIFDSARKALTSLEELLGIFQSIKNFSCPRHINLYEERVDFIRHHVKNGDFIGSDEFEIVFLNALEGGKGICRQIIRELQIEEASDGIESKIHKNLENLKRARDPILTAVAAMAAKAFRHRNLLLTGPAGIGKSHLLADTAARALAAGHPCVLLLGQQFIQGDVWSQIAQMLGVANRDRDDVLGALDAAAEHAGKRCAILIDAVNEGPGRRLWHTVLPEVAEVLGRYPNLALAVSCRSEYLPIVLPRAVRDDWPTKKVKGFATEDEQRRAAEVFLDRRGILRPATPWLIPEFTNPLFLQVTTQALRNRGERHFPRGLQGMTKAFKYFLDSLSLPDDIISPSDVRRLMKRFAAEMVQNESQWLSRRQMLALVRETLPGHDGNAVLDALCGASALLDTPDPSASVDDDGFNPPEDGFVFGFERLGDHLMAQVLVDLIEDPARCFQAGEPLAFLLDPKLKFMWTGLLAALAVCIPEKFPGNELVDLLPLEPGFAGIMRHDYWDGFKDSLRWRDGSAFSSRTAELFEKLTPDDRVCLLVEFAAMPGHPKNADALDQWLASLSLPERDELWSWPLIDASDDTHPLPTLFSWVHGPGLNEADRETLWLVGLLLTWALTTTNRLTRDHATKALTRLGLKSPGILIDLVRHFNRVNDLYVTERLFAAAYGAALNGMTDADLQALAQQVWEQVFEGGKPPLCLLTRDHAQGIMECAADRGVLPKHASLERCRPPHASSWPLEVVEENELERAEAPSIFGSTSECGDFGQYEIESAVKRFAVPPSQSKDFLQNAQRWVARRAVELGWTVARFEALEATIEWSSRGRPTTERIGKKYQWIALRELTARLSDNLPLQEEGRSLRTACDLAFTRDCDVSVMPTAPSIRTSPWMDWTRPSKVVFSATAEPAWVEGEADMLNTSDLFDVVDDQGRPWLVLLGFDRHSEGDGVAGRRDSWYRVDAFLVRRDGLNQAIASLKDQRLTEGPGFAPREEVNGGFLGEFPWRETWAHVRGLRPEFGDAGKNFGLTWPVHRYVWDSDMDLSLDGARAAVPSKALIDILALRSAGRAGRFAFADGTEALALDPRTDLPLPVIDKARFVAALDRSDWTCLWIVAGEKNWWPSGTAGRDLSCLYHTTLYWLRNGEWRSATHREVRVKGVLRERPTTGT